MTLTLPLICFIKIRVLNLVVVKLTTFQVTRLSMQHKICKIGMICPVKFVLTEDLCVVQKKEFFNNMLYVRNVHLTKGQTYSLQTNPSSRQRGCYIRTNKGFSWRKEISGRGSQGA
jgi:hypothetical protein